MGTIKLLLSVCVCVCEFVTNISQEFEGIDKSTPKHVEHVYQHIPMPISQSLLIFKKNIRFKIAKWWSHDMINW